VARLAREEKREVEEANAIVDGRKKEAARVVREEEIAETLKAREAVYREKSLQFAHKHAIVSTHAITLGSPKRRNVLDIFAHRLLVMTEAQQDRSAR